MLKKPFKNFIVEFIGTFALVFFGCGTAIVTNCSTADFAAYFATAAAFGLALTVMAYTIGRVSGCHLNPAVSLAVLLERRITVKQFIYYVIAQILGAVAAAKTLSIFIGSRNIGANQLWMENYAGTFLIEMLLTFFFVTCVLFACDKKNNYAGAVSGASLTLVHLIGIYFTGTSVNPARSIGPALVSGNLNGLVIFIAAPLAGAVFAAGLHMLLREKTSSENC